MADLSIKIKADTISAVQQFDELARSSETVQKQIQKTAESFDTDSIQRFIDRQKLAGAAITATRGELASITTQSKAYQKEIENLIKSGISPEDSAITKLQTEYDILQKRLEDNKKKTNETQQTAAQFAKKQEQIRAAITATKGPTEALKKSTSDYEKEIERLIKSGLSPQSEHIKELQKDYKNLKEQADNQTKGIGSLKDSLGQFLPSIGLAAIAYKGLTSAISAGKQFVSDSVEAYRELEKTMARTEAVLNASGAAAWTSAGQMKDFAQSLGESTGRSRNEIMEMQGVLLGFTSITGENFNRLTKNIVDMGDVMGGDLKSQANAFGKALDSPTKGMASLSRYGFVFTEQTKEEIKALEEAGKHTEAQTKLLEAMEAAFQGAATSSNNAAGNINVFSTELDYLKEEVGKAMKPLTETVIGFFTNVVKGARKGLEETNKFKEALKLEKAVENGSAEWGEGWEGALKKVQTETTILTRKLQEAKDRVEFDKAMNGVVNDRDIKLIDEYSLKLNALGAAESELIADRDRLYKEAAENQANAAAEEAAAYEAAQKTKAEAAKTLAQQLNDIKLTPEQNYAQDIKTFESYLKQRADLEEAAGNDRVAAIQAQEQRILENMNLTEGQKNALAESSAAMQEEIQKGLTAKFAKNETEAYEKFAEEQQKGLDLYKQIYEMKGEALLLYYETEKTALLEQQQALDAMEYADNDWKIAENERINRAILANDIALAAAEQKIKYDEKSADEERNKQRLAATANLFSSTSALLKAAGKDSAAAATAAKGIDFAQATISTAAAVANALKEGPTPLAIANSIAIGLAGAAQLATIASTPIPSAETGGRFLVPDTFTGVDSGLLRLNQGEEAKITPRGESGSGEALTVNVFLEGRPLIEYFNDKIYSREINIMAGLNV